LFIVIVIVVVGLTDTPKASSFHLLLLQSLLPTMVKRKYTKKKKSPVIVQVRPEPSISEVVVTAAPVVPDKEVDVTSSPSTSSTNAGAEASNADVPGDDPSNGSSSNSSNGSASNMLASSRDPKWGNLESMPQITKSPYELNESAEIGEPVFDELKTLVVHRSDGTLHPQAVRLFGHRLAESVVSAFQQIGVSGMLFSPSWQEGKIRGVQCGWIPKALLLLCLHEQRFTRSTEEAVLMSIVKDLGVAKIVADCMKQWQLEEDHLELVASLGGFSFARQKVVSFKSAIFVARAFRCVTALKHEKPSESLLDKVKKCLQIMNQNIRVNKGGLVRLQAELEKEKELEEIMQQKRRRQLELEQEVASNTPQDVTSVESNGTGTEVAATTENEADSSSSEPPSKRMRPTPNQPLTDLLAMFEEQYKRMGETLAIIRQKVQDNKETEDNQSRDTILVKSPKKNGKRGPKRKH